MQKVGPAQSLCGAYYAGPHAKQLSRTQWRGLFPGLHQTKQLVNAFDDEDIENCEVYLMHCLAAHLG